MTNKSPFVKIFTKDQNELTFEKLTRFEFVHSEAQDDYSRIELQTLDPNLVDDPNLQEGARLQILFGYIGGLVSKKYTLFVIDSSIDFGAQGIIISLDLGDKFQYAKHTSKKTIRSGTPDEILAQIAKENGLIYNGIDYTGLKIRGSEPVYHKSDSFATAAIDNTKVPVLRKIIIPQANRNDVSIANEVMKSQNGGPWIVTGHEEELIVKNINFNQSPIKIYTYKDEDGELIQFKPDSKNKGNKKESTNINVSSWDSLNKTYYQGLINQSHTNNPLLNQVVEYPNIGSIQGNEEDWEKKVLDNYNFGTSEKGENTLIDSKENINTLTSTKDGDDTNINIKSWVKNPEEIANKQIETSPTNGESPDIGNGKKWKFTELTTKSPSSLKLEKTPFATAATYNTSTISEGFEIVDIKQNQEQITEDTKEENATKALNTRDMKTYVKHKADIIVLGQPDLESGFILGILNVSKKYSGKYYMFSVKHVIDFAGGYLTHISSITNSFGKTPKDSASLLDGRDLGLPLNDSSMNNNDSISYKQIGN